MFDKPSFIKTTGKKILIEDETGAQKEVFEPEEYLQRMMAGASQAGSKR